MISVRLESGDWIGVTSSGIGDEVLVQSESGHDQVRVVLTRDEARALAVRIQARVREFDDLERVRQAVKEQDSCGDK